MRGLDKTDLSTYNPPKELIEKARQMRTDADSKKKRSIETGFKEYLKANPCSKDMDSDKIKEALLLNYMALHNDVAGFDAASVFIFQQKSE